MLRMFPIGVCDFMPIFTDLHYIIGSHKLKSDATVMWFMLNKQVKMYD